MLRRSFDILCAHLPQRKYVEFFIGDFIWVGLVLPVRQLDELFHEHFHRVSSDVYRV